MRSSYPSTAHPAYRPRGLNVRAFHLSKATPCAGACACPACVIDPVKPGPFIAIALCCLSAVLGIFRGLRWMDGLATLPPVAVALSRPPVPEGRRMRIGVVDMKRLFEGHPRTRQSQMEMANLRDRAKAELDHLRQTGGAAEATALREKRKRELEDESARMRREIVSDLQARVLKVTREQDLDLVLDSSGMSLNGTSIVMSAGGAMDLTNGILRELQP